MGAAESFFNIEGPVFQEEKRLLGNEIHIWRYTRSVHLNPEEFFPFLSVGEIRKAVSFEYEFDREDYVIGRVLLRRLISQYSAKPPLEIQLLSTRSGKPYVDPVEYRFNFSCAQSGSEQVFVFSQADYIGVDLEFIDQDIDWLSLASLHFSASEMTALMRLSDDKRIASFYKLWTTKEAYMKALSKESMLSSKSFSVHTRGGSTAVLDPKNFGNARKFRFFHPTEIKGYSCTIATTSLSQGLKIFTIG